MANRKSRHAITAKEKGWWPESWVPVLVGDGGPLPFGHTMPYDPKNESTKITSFPPDGRYVVGRSSTNTPLWVWEAAA